MRAGVATRGMSMHIVIDAFIRDAIASGARDVVVDWAFRDDRRDDDENTPSSLATTCDGAWVRVRDDGDGVRLGCDDDGAAVAREDTIRMVSHACAEVIVRTRRRGEMDTYISRVRAAAFANDADADDADENADERVITTRDTNRHRDQTGADVTLRAFAYNNRLALDRMRERRAQEVADIRQVVFHAALMTPYLAIRARCDGVDVDRIAGNRTSVLDGLRLAFGDDVARSLRLVDYTSDDGAYEIRGYVSAANRRLGSRELQYVYVNGARIRGASNALHRALIQYEADAFLGDGARKSHGKGYAGFLISIACPHDGVCVTQDVDETLLWFERLDVALEHVKRAVVDADDCWPVRDDDDDDDAAATEQQPQRQQQEGQNQHNNPGGSKRDRCACCAPADGPFARSTLRRLSADGPFASSSALSPQTTAAHALETWSNPAFTAASELPIVSVDALASSSMFKPPASLDASDLTDARIVAQVGDKFIVTVLRGDLIVAIDQHAADERISLEELWARVLMSPDVPAEDARTPWPTPLSAFEHAQLHANADIVRRWGWDWIDARSEREHEVHLTRLPTIRGTALGGDALREFIDQLASTTSQSSQPPRALHRLLASKACRGAIMFGDTLSKAECEIIIGALKLTTMPFACAHGRPTVAPLARVVASSTSSGGVADSLPNIRAWIRARDHARAQDAHK